MNSFIAWLITLLASTSANTSLIADGYSATSILGLVLIFVIIGAPIYMLILASIFGRPRMPKTTGIFLAFIIVLIAGFVVSSYILGAVLSLVVP